MFNENYNDKVVAGSDRYYEPESADKRDAPRRRAAPALLAR